MPAALLPVLSSLALLTPSAEPPQAPAIAPLRGPAITDRLARPTLVSYDMNGRLRDLESSPERLAVRMLDLDPGSREAVESVFTARAAKVDAFVAENLSAFGQLDTAGKAGAKLDAALLLGALLERGWDLVREPPLRVRIAGVLPPEQVSRFRATIAEYRCAWRKQARADARAKGDRPTVWALALAEHASSLGAEVRLSYERQAASGTLIADYLLAGVTLTPEQQALVRELKADMLRRTNFKPTEKDQRTMVLGIIAHLPPRERENVARKIANR
jgi:hypothetical protein